MNNIYSKQLNKMKAKTVIFVLVFCQIVVFFISSLAFSSENNSIKDNSNWMQRVTVWATLGLAVATTCLAIFTYMVVRENKRLLEQNEGQFRIGKSPIFDTSIGSKLNISDNGTKDGEKLYRWEIPVKIRNIGYGPAFNIYPRVKQGNLEYEFNGISSNIIELGFTLGVGAETTLNFEKSGIIGKQLENLLQIEITCHNIFGTRVIHEFKASTGQLAEDAIFSLKRIEFVKE